MNTPPQTNIEFQADAITAELKKRQSLNQNEIAKIENMLAEFYRLAPPQKVRVESVGKTIRNPM
jgi:hypothetical protein